MASDPDDVKSTWRVDGWARPKKKVSPHAPSKRFKPKPDSKAVIGPKRTGERPKRR